MKPGPSITIVSGCPGSGKTTVSRSLAKEFSNGLHIPSDLFYEFPARLIDPTDEASHHQNTVMMRALARTAVAFAEGGYQVVLDGIFGPWFLPTLHEEIPSEFGLSYIVLRVPEAVALERVRGRDGPGATAKVEHMVAAFAALDGFEGHAIDTRDLSPEQVLETIQRGLADDRFLLTNHVAESRA